MVVPNVVLRVLPELILVLARDDPATDARDLLHALIVCGKDVDAKQLLLQWCEQQGSVAWSARGYGRRSTSRATRGRATLPAASRAETLMR